MGHRRGQLAQSETRDALAPQDCLYTTAVRLGAGTDHRIIGSVLVREVAKEKPRQLIARLAHLATRIVSLTVTEKGYCHKPQTGDLDEHHPDIVHDLQNPARRARPSDFWWRRWRASGLQAQSHSPFCPATISPPMAIPWDGS